MPRQNQGQIKTNERKKSMNRLIRETSVVSDGIVVEFQGGLRCYFSADFLLDNINRGSNRVFLDYDPTPSQRFEVPEMPAAILNRGISF
jgi:hypothetical protein